MSEYRTCGDESCHCMSGGEKHGPYRYRVYREGGSVKKKSISGRPKSAKETMSDQSRAELRERVVRTVDYKTADSAPDALDVDHIRVHLCANAQYAVDEINRAIGDALEAGDLVELRAAASSPTIRIPLRIDRGSELRKQSSSSNRYGMDHLISAVVS